MHHVLVIIFKSAEPSEEIRRFLRKYGGVDFGGIWFLPNAAPPDLCMETLLRDIPSLREGVAVMSVMRHESLVHIHDWPELAEWFQRAREQGQ